VRQRNPDTSYCEVLKAQWDGSGVHKILDVVAVVEGRDRAASVAEAFTRRMTEEEKLAGIDYYQRYTSRNAWCSWRLQHPAGRVGAKPGRSRGR